MSDQPPEDFASSALPEVRSYASGALATENPEEILRSGKGLGPVEAYTVVVESGEFGRGATMYRGTAQKPR